jgi:hypothetical protein
MTNLTTRNSPSLDKEDFDIFATRKNPVPHVVLDPDNLSGKVGTEYESRFGTVCTVKTQSELDHVLSRLPKGPAIIVVVIGPKTALVDGMGLGQPHRHLNPIEITYFNKSGKRIRVARLVNF